MGVRIRTVALLVVVALAAVACGDSAKDQADQAISEARARAEKLAAEARKRLDDAAKSIGSSTVPGGSGSAKKRAFKELDAKVRFVNIYADAGTGTPIDVYFGQGDTGKKAATVAFGEATEFMPVQVDADPMLTPADGSVEMEFDAYLPGESAIPGRLMMTSEQYESGGVYTVVFGWGDGTGSSGHTSTSSNVIFDSKATTPPDGKAFVYKLESGISGISGGDFVGLAPQGSCDWTRGTDEQAGGVNAGVPYVADAGTVTVQVSDENTNCTAAVTTVDLDLAAGDSWVVILYGTTKDDRKALPLKLQTS